MSLFEHFEVHRMSGPLFTVGGHSVSFTNSSLYMFISIAAAFLFFAIALKPKAVIPGRLQMSAEVLYNLVGGMLADNAGAKARPFFPFVFSIFAFIFFCNLSGMFPWSFSVTSHVVVNFAIAILLFSAIIITGFVKHGLHFIKLFVPPGAPILAVPLLFFIEMFSFAIRPFSLSIRLFSNMLAGHLLLLVFATMTTGLVTAGWLSGLSVFPVTAEIVLIAFEFFVAFLQAYIYTILACVYLHDAIEMH
jgi:F-type H+-transporting ATPase subunit a